jgi:F0F1-type ATP synthase delta subunit
MDQHSQALDLSDLFNTRPQAVDFSARVTTILKKVFEKEFNPEKVFMEQFGIERKDKFMTLLRDNNINAQSRLDIKNFLERIQTLIATLPVISLVLAFEPNEKTLQMLSRWFVLNTNKQVLFDIKVDNGLIGGAAILSGGKYLDFSIKPEFDKIFAQTFRPQTVPTKQ